MGKPVCNLCPRGCRVDRTLPDPGRAALCGAGPRAKVALVSLHPWEEPCIAGRNGAGTVFFSHCNLRCCFCQNHEISRLGRGIEVGDGRLAEIFLEQQDRGAACVELVTPSHYAPSVVRALRLAKGAGLSIPVAYNTNGYDLPCVVDALAGLVDVFLPDLKYFDSRLGERYSGVPRYFEFASAAIRRMREAAGPPRFGPDGVMTGGVLVRHLVLPGCSRDSVRCVEWLWETFGDGIVMSLMSQYTPLYGACRRPEINRRLTSLEYRRVVRRAEDLGATRCYIQVGRADGRDLIPVFDGRGVLPGPRDVRKDFEVEK